MQHPSLPWHPSSAADKSGTKPPSRISHSSTSAGTARKDKGGAVSLWAGSRRFASQWQVLLPSLPSMARRIWTISEHIGLRQTESSNREQAATSRIRASEMTCGSRSFCQGALPFVRIGMPSPPEHFLEPRRPKGWNRRALALQRAETPTADAVKQAGAMPVETAAPQDAFGRGLSTSGSPGKRSQQRFASLYRGILTLPGPLADLGTSSAREFAQGRQTAAKGRQGALHAPHDPANRHPHPV